MIRGTFKKSCNNIMYNLKGGGHQRNEVKNDIGLLDWISSPVLSATCPPLVSHVGLFSLLHPFILPICTHISKVMMDYQFVMIVVGPVQHVIGMIWIYVVQHYYKDRIGMYVLDNTSNIYNIITTNQSINSIQSRMLDMMLVKYLDQLLVDKYYLVE